MSDEFTTQRSAFIASSSDASLIVELTIDKVVYGGSGIGRVGQTVVFVPFSAPGDRLKVRVIARKRNYWTGRIDEVLEASPLRTDPPCIYYGTCGGCDLQHLRYDAQLVTKKLVLNESLQRIGKIFVPPGNPLGIGEPWRYRNKSQFQVTGPGWRIGYFERGTHEVVDVERCLIQPEEFDGILTSLRASLTSSGETAYMETGRTGNIRHIVAARGAGTGETTLTFVCATESLSPEAYAGLRQGSDSRLSIVHNYNPDATNRIMGSQFRTLAGAGLYHEKLLDKRLRISAGSFFQANTAATELIIKRILKYIEPDGRKTVLDLFCGIGTIALPISGFVGKVIGIEVNAQAVADARANAAENGCPNVEFIEGEVEQTIGQVGRADTVILDPPRKGCTPELLRRISLLHPQEIVYVSCNPSTLARDLAVFAELGYDPVEIQPVDMFPQTSHIEAVAKLVPSRIGTTGKHG